MQRLGGSVVHVNESTSSTKKGETLTDTIRCMTCYCDTVGTWPFSLPRVHPACLVYTFYYSTL